MGSLKLGTFSLSPWQRFSQLRENEDKNTRRRLVSTKGIFPKQQQQQQQQDQGNERDK